MRTALTAADIVRVENWHDLGYATEAQGEDGPYTVLPPHAPVITLLTARGDYSVLDRSFGEEQYGNWRLDEHSAWRAAWTEAESLASDIRATGSVNLSKWRYLRGVYGSAAYVEDGWEQFDMALD